jgi:sterol desaturase/sphingolipid hydroxylase (fatty acid hydroxylase superfamily)
MIVFVLCFLGGAATWLFAEYQLHRFVGHGSGKSLFAVEHRRHHSVGDYFARSWKKALNVGPVLLALGGFGCWFFGPGAVAYAAGLSLMYLAYEILHRRLHTHPPINRFGRWARRHHFFHHFHEPAKNHGVTTPIFDRLFGSESIPAHRIRVPAKLAMQWLVDPSTKRVHSAYAADYELR